MTAFGGSATLSRMTEDELQDLLDKTLPEADRHDVFVEQCQDQDVRLRFSLKPGETWSTAALLALVDTSLRAAAGLSAGLSHLNVTVLKAAQQADVIAPPRVIPPEAKAIPAAPRRLSHA